MDVWTDIMDEGNARMAARAERIRHWLDRKEANEADWVEVTLGLIEEISAARAEFSANREFSIWLMDNELERLDPNDRAAAISLGANMRLARMALTETQSRSLQLIWREWHNRYRARIKRTVLLMLVRRLSHRRLNQKRHHWSQYRPSRHCRFPILVPQQHRHF